MPSSQVRLPLQTGDSALAAFARGLSMFVVATGIQAVAIAQVGGNGNPITATIAGTIGLYVFFWSLRHFRDAYARRASDIVFRDDGVEIRGGKLDGRTLAWSEISVARSEVLVVSEDLASRGKNELAHLILGLDGGDTLQIAAAQTADEKASLGTILAMLRSPRWRRDAEIAPPRAVDPTVLVCGSCGAPASLADADTVPCRHCGAVVPIPAELRARIRAATTLSELQARTARQLRRALAQPTAGRVNVLFAIAVALAVVLGAIGVVLGHLGSLVVELVLLGIVLGFFVHATAGRRAFQAVARLGAIEPARTGDPYTCRRCLAPLPDASGRLVVACAYCSAENVLGLDLRRDAQEAAAAESDLASALGGGAARNARVLALLVVPVVLSFGLFAFRAKQDADAKAEKRAADARFQAGMEKVLKGMTPSGIDLAERGTIQLPRSTSTGAVTSPYDPAILVGPKRLAHGDTELPPGPAGLLQLKGLLHQDDALLDGIVPGSHADVRIVADARTPLAVLTPVVATLGPRAIAIVTLGPDGAEHSIALPKPVIPLRGLRDAGTDAGAPRPTFVPPADVDLQTALAQRDARAAAEHVDVTLDLSGSR